MISETLKGVNVSAIVENLVKLSNHLLTESFRRYSRKEQSTDNGSAVVNMNQEITEAIADKIQNLAH